MESTEHGAEVECRERAHRTELSRVMAGVMPRVGRAVAAPAAAATSRAASMVLYIFALRTGEQ